MKKSVIALAIAGVCSVPFAAQAETTIFGKMHMSAGMVSETEAGVTTTDNWQNRSHASRLGVKGFHDLGDGMKANYHIEFQVDPDSENAESDTDSGSAGLKRRNQWVGLAAGWGEVRIGRHDTPLKMAQGKFDQFNDTDADIKGHYKISQGENRADNVLAYIGKFGGLTLAAAALASEGDGEASGDSAADTISVAAMYKSGPLFVSLAQDAYDSADGSTPDSLTRLVATYKMGSMQAGVLYETGGNGGNANADEPSKDKDVMGVSFAMGMGDNKLKLQYMTGEDKQDTPVETTQTSIGFDAKLGKKVTAYVMHTTAEKGEDNDYAFTGAGLIVKF